MAMRRVIGYIFSISCNAGLRVAQLLLKPPSVSIVRTATVLTLLQFLRVESTRTPVNAVLFVPA